MIVDANAEGTATVVDILIVLGVGPAMVKIIEGGIRISCGWNNVSKQSGQVSEQ